MLRDRSRRAYAAALAVPLLLALTAGPGAAAAPAVRFTIDMGSSCIAGVGPKAKTLTIVLKSAGGSTLGTTSDKTSSTGRFSACFTGTVPVVTGTKLIAKQGSTVLRTMTVPRLVVRSDRGDDKVTGKAIAGRVVRVAAWDCHTDVSTCTKQVDRRITANAKGGFATDMTSVFDATGHDDLLVSTTTSAGDLVRRSIEFPTVYILPTFNTVTIRANAGTIVKGRYLDGPGGAELETKDIAIGPGGSGSWELFPVVPEVLEFDFETDAVVPAADWAIQIPATTVSGLCYKNAPVLVEATGGGRQFATTTNASGEYAFNFATAPGGALDVSGQTIRIWCFTPTFDALVLQATAP